MAPHDSSCFAGFSVFSVVLGSLLSVGIIVSYVPQMWIIAKKQSSEGVSYWTMWFSYIAAYLTLINVILLKWDDITCTQYLGIVDIYAILIPIIQLIVGPLSLYILYILVVIYMPRKPNATNTLQQRRRHYWISVALFFIGLIVSIALALGAVAFVGKLDSHDDALLGYAKGLGLASAIITFIVWLPQIWTTWKLKDPGSLSVVMLCIQMPGALLVVFFQGFVNHGDWTTWVPYVATAFQEAVLIGLWAWFSITNRRKRAAVAHKETEVASLLNAPTLKTARSKRPHCEPSFDVSDTDPEVGIYPDTHQPSAGIADPIN
eukprot:TRINITY_DN9264_c0_g1_i1.p1 TRINITY_DN9264_c0_g1~~TRINITY_DN9264_c0_g1_i1.p1  ORF type:complete len:319 (-),score=33.46 TRINITY_DN9264_c0_g1_i1:173-1129(-)